MPAPGRGARASQRAGRKLPAPARGGRAAITAGPGPGPRLPPGRDSRRPRTACPPGERGEPQRAGVESEVSAGGGLVSRLTPLRRLL